MDLACHQNEVGLPEGVLWRDRRMSEQNPGEPSGWSSELPTGET